MEAFDVDARERTPAGRAGIRQTREEGFVPGILYSEGSSLPISLPKDQLRQILDKNGENVFINLHIGGRNFVARFQEVQRDPVTTEIRHVDLMPVEPGQMH